MKLALLAVWFITLPYLSRLPLGADWMLTYLPYDGKLLFGLAFFSAFNCLPALVVMAALKGMEPINKQLAVIPLLVMSGVTAWAHYDYDLAADAQAAIWLVIAPVYVAFLGGLSMVVVLAVAWFTQRRKSQPEERKV